MSVLDEIKELREILKRAPPNMDYDYDGFQDECARALLKEWGVE